MSLFQLVVGDIVCLNIRDQVSADGLFVEGHSLKVDESNMIGESDHVEINDKNSMGMNIARVLRHQGLGQIWYNVGHFDGDEHSMGSPFV